MAKNQNYIRTERGWNAHSNDMKRFFGLDPKKKWPANGMAAITIQGVPVFVISLAQAKERKVFHRVRANCPACNMEMSAGRLHQHVCN